MLTTIDITIVAIYTLALFALAQWVSRDTSGDRQDAQGYFLAGRALPWWAIGASLIAANISAEQIIGMSGSGYAIGLKNPKHFIVNDLSMKRRPTNLVESQTPAKRRRIGTKGPLNLCPRCCCA